MSEFDLLPDGARSELETLNHLRIEVGVFGTDDTYMPMIASVNEFGANIKSKNGKYLTIPTKLAGDHKASEFSDLFFGTGKNGGHFLGKENGKGGIDVYFWCVNEVHIPERSFIRSTFDENLGSWVDRCADWLVEVATGDMSAKTMLEKLGNVIVKDIQAKIRAIQEPANSPATIERKGSTSPLEDTGHLIQAITYRVVEL
ncbi:hypothetical protein ACFP1L_11960 [Lactiplantibacillus nangangensis]|uniref:Uncharacterized protein n=1 Tax=Lactiplantibacillus nangangensis TaxID=2559917 RepID=A0ABW1SMS0_9LACO|nr:hypothetical protein [Lactiplantibacillus nangangensis]